MRTYIVYDYSSFYERIYTRRAFCMFFLKLRFLFKGYRVWAYPTIWMAKVWFKIAGKRSYRGVNVQFEKYIPGTGQTTYWEPWMNFM